MLIHFFANAGGGGCTPGGRGELPEAGPYTGGVNERVAYGKGEGLCWFGRGCGARNHDEAMVYDGQGVGVCAMEGRCGLRARLRWWWWWWWW
jgi:hypothetical protein